MLLVPDAAEVLMLQQMLNVEPPEDIEIGLFINNVRPASRDTMRLYDEADFEGYSRQRLSSARWRFTPGPPALAVYDELTWACSRTREAQPVYGYVAVGCTTHRLRWVERFEEGPYPMANLGDMVKLIPTIGIESGVR